jgi:AcrR family transcriptional regulator
VDLLGNAFSRKRVYRHFEHKEEVFFARTARYLPTFLHAFEMHLPGTAHIEGNLMAIALAGMEYFGELILMSASFLADTELLAQYRQKMSKVTSEQQSGGPQHIENLLATYLEEERQLGRLQSPTTSRALALLLLGACFQNTYLSQLMGTPPAGKVREQFARELVRGTLDDSQPS